MTTSSETPILITLQELKLLGYFPRCQDISGLLAEKVQADHNLFSYPLFKTRLPSNVYIDIVAEDGHWIKVKFTGEINNYLAQKAKKYLVAPAGYYTDNTMEVPELKTIEFDDSRGTIFKNRTIQSSKVIDVSGPYLTFDVKWYNSASTWVDEEENYFQKQLPIFQKEFIQNVIVLNEGSSDYETRAWCMLELMLSAFQSSIINENTIQKNLSIAIKKAKDYVTLAGWKDGSMQKHFMSGLTNQSYKQWSSDPTNVAIYNTVISKRNEIENLFSKELLVINEGDREIILDLVRKLCFSRE
jgi:hypothetical protein